MQEVEVDLKQGIVIVDRLLGLLLQTELKSLPVITTMSFSGPPLKPDLSIKAH